MEKQIDLYVPARAAREKALANSQKSHVIERRSTSSRKNIWPTVKKFLTISGLITAVGVGYQIGASKTEEDLLHTPYIEDARRILQDNSERTSDNQNFFYHTDLIAKNIEETIQRRQELQLPADPRELLIQIYENGQNMEENMPGVFAFLSDDLDLGATTMEDYAAKNGYQSIDEFIEATLSKSFAYDEYQKGAMKR